MTIWRLGPTQRLGVSAPRQRAAHSPLTGFLVMAGIFCLIGQAAHAHAFLERASPAVGSEVHGSPPRVTLSYTEGIEPAFSNVTVTDVAGNRVDKDSLTTQGDGRVVVVPLKPLSPGTYAVEWHVTSVDTHKTQGHFSFTVVP